MTRCSLLLRPHAQRQQYSSSRSRRCRETATYWVRDCVRVQLLGPHAGASYRGLCPPAREEQAIMHDEQLRLSSSGMTARVQRVCCWPQT